MEPSKLLKLSKMSMSDVVESCSWYLVAIWTHTCRFWRMLEDSMALIHSNESSTDRLPDATAGRKSKSVGSLSEQSTVDIHYISSGCCSWVKL